MYLDYLEWDSAFFNKRIGKLVVNSHDTKEKITQILKSSKNKYDLLYVFCPENYYLTERDGLKLVDRKVVFAEVFLDKDFKPDSNIQKYIDSPNSYEDLTTLAHIAAKYSRFKTDPYFDNDDYKRLYRCWIDQSINHNLADEILCFYDGNNIIGMLTLQIKGNSGIISLIAVKDEAQNQGIGSRLITTAKFLCLQQGAYRIEVSTQLENSNACFLYKKNNLAPVSITNIYHYWS